MGALSQEEIEQADATKNQIRCLISNVYDLQKMRIQAGNRLVQSFYIQLGIMPSTSPDEAEGKERSMIKDLKSEYDRITDGIVANNTTIKKQIKLMNSDKEDKNHLKFIHSDTDYKLIETYALLLEAEDKATKVLEQHVHAHPLWDDFFKDIKGCGALMSGVCIAYIDIKKAKYVSSIYKYAGLDTVQDEDKDGNKLFKPKINGVVSLEKVRRKVVYTDHVTGEPYMGVVKDTGEMDAEGTPIFKGENGQIIDAEFAMNNGEVIYEYVNSGEEYVGEVVVSMHGRRKGDTEMFEYEDKKTHEMKLKRGITYNPFLKSKLMGVLPSKLLMCKDPYYSQIYYDMRQRLDNEGDERRSYTDGHKMFMAYRYMIKQFLRDLYTHWRKLEGLPVHDSYEVAKLGHMPHKYNEYQHMIATGASESQD